MGGRVGINAGPFIIGPKRWIRPALTCAQLPRIDLILLSHCHFDHLDLWTLKRIRSRPILVAPRHTADLLRKTRAAEVRELDWGERVGLLSERGGIEIEAFATAHWGARMGADRHRKWNGYIVERHGRKVLFGGDTGMTSAFGELRRKGPFDVAIMPIGAYDPWITSHCTPEQALAMADAAGAEYILPVHHQTFVLSREPMREPITRLERALAQAPTRLALKNVGETFVLPNSSESSRSEDAA